jgi:hypothetical protein
MKPGTPLLRSTRLLDQVRERIRYLHYSLSHLVIHNAILNYSKLSVS